MDFAPVLDINSNTNNTVIGDRAFYDCISLKNITIPNNVNDCAYMFNDCTIFDRAIIIPDGVENCAYMFANSSNF